MKISRKWTIVLTGIVILTAVTGAVFWRQDKGQKNPDVPFSYFEPSYLPPNTSVKAKRVVVSPNNTVRSVEQNFRTEDWVYDIQQFGVDKTVSIENVTETYDPKSIKPSCTIRVTPAQMRYRLCHWVDYGRINVYEVIFIKNGTRVISRAPAQIDQGLTVDQIEKYIDSFQQRDTSGLPVLRSNGS